MSQGLYTAISGITNAQTQISVIADNIANMNTTGFKESTITFENIYSKTLTTGTAPSTQGGTNPMQIGLGVRINDISRNFSNGNVQTTGRSSDLNIQGNGYFTMTNSDGSLFFTRAGNFSLDSNGNLVNPSGLNVLGTNSVFSTEASKTNVKIPPALQLRVEGTSNAKLAAKQVSELNNAEITDGTFTINAEYTDTATGVSSVAAITVNVTQNSTIQNILDQINNAATTPSGLVTASIQNGKLVIDKAATPPTGYTQGDLTIGSDDDTTNFVSTTQLSSDTSAPYTSKVMDYWATIDQAGNANNSPTLSSYSFGKDGAIQATYTNGDKLTVVTDGNDKKFKYITSTSVEIDAENITVNNGVLTEANLQVQLANVTNDKGLVSEGGNMFQLGPNTGNASFSIANKNDMGEIATNGLESSNVDLPTQFANMIVAQRSIDANSRTFSALNEILTRIVNLGR